MSNNLIGEGGETGTSGSLELLGTAGGLGFAAAYKRDVVKHAPLYDQLYPVADNTRLRVSARTTAADTAAKMASLAPDYAWQTAKVAETLRGRTIGETLQAVWNHVYNHFQYELDKEGTEEVRTPARSWADRFRGIDCDCMSFLIATILHNLNIRYEFRVTKYDHGWQHIYIVVPASMHPKGYYTIDCVLDRFDYEKNFSDFFNTKAKMGLGIPLELLGNLAADEPSMYMLENIVTGKHFNRLEGLGDATGADQALLQHIIDTRDFIKKNPGTVLNQGGAAPMVKMLDYAVANWNTQHRESALNILEKEEERWNATAGLTGCMEDSINGLGAIKGERRFFGKIKEAAGKIKEAAGNAGAKIKEAAKKAVKAVVRFNPITLAMRGGLLLAFKINLFKMAEQAYPGTRSGASSSDKTMMLRLEKLFTKIGGREDKLRKAIEHGYARKHELLPDGVRPTISHVPSNMPPGAAKPNWVDPTTLPTPVPGMKKGGANSNVDGLGIVDPVTDTALLTAVPVILEAYNVIVNKREPGEVNGLGEITSLLRPHRPNALGVVSAFPLKKGSKGPLVQTLQEGLLATFGKAALPKYGADGSWGAELDAAISKYKLKNEIDEPTLKQYIITSFGTVDPSKVDWGTQKPPEVNAADPTKTQEQETADNTEAASAAAKGDRGKFMQKIKAWLQRRKNKRAAIDKVAADTSTENNATPPADTKSADSAGDDAAADNDGKGPQIGDEKPGQAQDGIIGWIKNNPGKTAAGVLIIGTGITLAVSPKAREFVGLGSKKSSAVPQPQLNGLNQKKNKKPAGKKKLQKIVA